MKKSISWITLIILLLLFNNNSYSQSRTSIGLNIGGAKLNMSEINDDMNEIYKLGRSDGLPISRPNEVSGALFLEGFLSTKFKNNTLIGFGVDYLSSSGKLTFTELGEGNLAKKYNVKTIELLGHIGVAIPINNTTSEVFFKLYGGYGFASALHTYIINLYSTQGIDYDSENDVSKGYFAARLQGGVEIILQQVGINFSLSYRLANAGLKRRLHI